MGDLAWIQYTDRMVGRNHPILTDTLNAPLREVLSDTGYDPDAATFPGLYGPVFNVKAYGALGDGVTDDSAAITAAVNAVPSQGGIVFFPAGVFALSNTVTVNARTDIAFIGAGANATRIQQNVEGVTLLNFSGICSRITIRDLWFGATSSFAAGAALNIVGTSGTHSDSFRIENVVIQNSPTPVYLEYLDQSHVAHLIIKQTISGAVKGVGMRMDTCLSDTFDDVLLFASAGTFPSEGIRVDYDTDTIIFTNSQVLNAGTFGWRISQTAGSTGPRLSRFLNCYAESCGSDGFLVQAGRDVRFTGCHSAVNSGMGWDITGGDSIVLQNCLALQNSQHGIAVTGAGEGLALIGNSCSNNSQQTTNTYHGIILNGSMTGARVIGNRSGDFVFSLSNKQAIGLNIASASVAQAVVVDNDLRGNQTGSINDSGTGTYRRANRGTTGAMQGRAVLSGGTATVNTTEVVASDNILLSEVVSGGTAGALRVSAIVGSTSFTITSSSGSDTGTVFWEIVH